VATDQEADKRFCLTCILAKIDADLIAGASVVEFDPVREVGKLREHLASGDKLISFLFGAGTSAVLGSDGHVLLPLVAGLTSGCKEAVEALGPEYSKAWSAINDGPEKSKWTIEDVLSFVRQMKSAALPGDRLAGLTSDQITTMERTIRSTISRLVRPEAARYPSELPHRALARWIRRIDRLHPVEIFTTNYDTLFERAMELEKVPLFDGFAGSYEPFFYPASLKFESSGPASDWTRLWKVHGSVTWSVRESSEQKSTIIRGAENESGEMILPSVLKYDESRKQPYVAMLDRFGAALNNREDGVLVVVGYSFGDQHINEILFEALSHNPRLHLFALCYGDLPDDNALSIFAKGASNVLVLGRSGAVVNGQSGLWRAANVDEAAKRLDGLFELADPATTDAADRGMGSLRLGDFTVFCALLNQIAGTE
jgi:hypothetical protein